MVTIAGVIGIAWYWNWQKHKLEQYRHLDVAYNELLKVYFENPRFGQPDLASSYAEAFAGDERWKYHYFAMRVHTFLESIYDIAKAERPRRERGDHPSPRD